MGSGRSDSLAIVGKSVDDLQKRERNTGCIGGGGFQTLRARKSIPVLEQSPTQRFRDDDDDGNEEGTKDHRPELLFRDRLCHRVGTEPFAFRFWPAGIFTACTSLHWAAFTSLWPYTNTTPKVTFNCNFAT